MAYNLMYTQPNGVVAIVRGAPKAVIEEQLGPLTNAQYKQFIRDRSIPSDATNVREILDANIPEDRTYREAWVDVTAKATVDINLEKVRQQLLRNTRKDRAVHLAALDVEALKAIEEGQPLEDIKARKQALRDATDTLKNYILGIDEVNDATKLAALEAAAILPTI